MKRTELPTYHYCEPCLYFNICYRVKDFSDVKKKPCGKLECKKRKVSEDEIFDLFNKA